jgi:hypothetical protein
MSRRLVEKLIELLTAPITKAAAKTPDIALGMTMRLAITAGLVSMRHKETVFDGRNRNDLRQLMRQSWDGKRDG